MSGFNPEPTIAVGEWPLARETTFQGRRAFDASQRTLVNGLSIKWGRSNVWDQPDPASITFEMFDPSAWWIQRVANRTAIGVGVSVSWKLPAGASQRDAPGGTFTIFQGLTTKVNARPHRAWTTEGYRDGWIVTVTAADRTATLSNVSYLWAELFPDTMVNRAIRLRNDAAGSGIRQWYFDAGLAQAPVSYTKLENKTGRDYANEFYTSTGDQYAYNPNRNVVNRIGTHYGENFLYLIRDTVDNTVYLYFWPLVDPSGAESDQDKASYATGTLDGSQVSCEIEASAGQANTIDQVNVKWLNSQDNNRPILTYQVRAGATAPYRSLDFESWMSDGRNIDPMHYKVQDRAFTDSAGPHHPPVVFDTAYTGGFHNSQHAQMLTLPYESIQCVPVAGSPWYSALGIPPFAAISGGEIAYSDGDWKITCNLVRHRVVSNDAHKNPPPWKNWFSTMVWDSGPEKMHISRGISWSDLQWTSENAAVYDMPK